MMICIVIHIIMYDNIVGYVIFVSFVKRVVTVFKVFFKARLCLLLAIRGFECAYIKYVLYI